MEAAIAAMMAPVGRGHLELEASQRKRPNEKAGGDEGMVKRKRKKREGESEVVANLDASNRSGSSAMGASIFGKTLAGANFVLKVDNMGKAVVVEMNEDGKIVSGSLFRLRSCFQAIMTLKIAATQGSLNQLNLSALTDALRGSSKLQHLMKLRDKLKNALKYPFKSTTTLKVHALIDSLYMELLPLAAVAAHTNGVQKGVLPDPAAYLASALHGQLNGEEEMFGKETNRVQAYLQLRQVEAKHLQLSRVIAEVVELEGLSSMTSDHTMRGTCPIGSTTLRQWQDSSRDRVCHWSAFACPDNEALQLFISFCEAVEAKNVVELGAGTGYWARLIRKYSKTVKLRATDALPPRGQGIEEMRKMNGYHGCFAPWTHIETLAAKKAGTIRCDVLLLVYPPPSDPMAMHALQSTKSPYCIYVGEFRGDTADAAFEIELFSQYICVKVKALPCWTNTADRISFWVKKGVSDWASVGLGEFTPTTPLSCAGCGKDLVPAVLEGRGLYRDRLTRCIFACKEGCAREESTCKAVEKEATLRHLEEVHKLDMAFNERWAVVKY